MTHDESRAWEMFAAAAMSASFYNGDWSKPFEEIGRLAEMAGLAADALLAERSKRMLNVDQRCPASTMVGTTNDRAKPVPCILVRGHVGRHVFPTAPVPTEGP